MVEIIPAVYPIPRTYKEFQESVSRVADLVPLVQLDVMDGKFTKHASWPYGGFEREFKEMVRNRSPLPHADMIDYEVDLMVERPEEVLEDWMHLRVRRVVVHIESTKNMQNILNDVAAHVTRATTEEDLEVVSLGVALDVGTPTERIESYVTDIDFVQCMGIASIGKQGEPFDERVLEHVLALRSAHPELIISVDGGVNEESAPRLVEAGVNRLVAGSFIGKSEDTERAIAHLRALAA